MKIFEYSKNIAWTILAIIISILAILKMVNKDGEIKLDKESLQANSLSAITNGELSYNEILSNVNQYRTNKPWIAASNNRIWAGIYNRDWSIEYSSEQDKKLNEVGILIGTGFGLYYQRTIFDSWTIGVEAFSDRNNDFNIFGKTGYKF